MAGVPVGVAVEATMVDVVAPLIEEAEADLNEG